MTRMKVEDYVKKNNYSLTQRQLAYWAKIHEKAVKEGDKDTEKWVEDMLTCINYHKECSCFRQGNYSEVLVKTKYKRNYGKEYEYNGEIVIPYGSFKNRGSIKYLNCNLMLNIPRYNHEEFYRVLENSEADVFMVKGYNQLFVPSAKGLIMIPREQVICKIAKK